MALEDSFENAYETLGLTDGGPSTSESDIKKAYRRLALQKHPDKNPDNPDAAQEFSRIQKAYDILCDSEARTALDEWLRVQSFRQQKTAFRDQKRRKMAEELEKREKMSDFSTAENAAKVKLQQQIERLRQMAAQKEEDAYVERQKDIGRGNKVDERMFRTFKVNWKKDLDSSPDLVDIFSKFGRVEDVVVRESKKGKNSALIVMETQDSHNQILRASAERKLGDLKVTPLVTGQTHPMRGNTQAQEHVTLGEYRFPPNKRDTSVRLFPAAKSAAPFDVEDKETKLGDFEAQVLGKLQRKRVAD